MLRLNMLTKPAIGLVRSFVAIGVLSLTACGGGGGGSEADSDKSSLTAKDPVSAGSDTLEQPQAFTITGALTPNSRGEAARFLTQATFGPTDAEVDRLLNNGYAAWFSEQATFPTSVSYKTYWDQRNAAIKKATPALTAATAEITHAFWANAIGGKDQLRQRVALALSEIFVVSTSDGCGANNPQGVASYMDMLGQRALGRYRDLLEAVALHPIMGCYLSHLRNQKEDTITGRIPDENFAREVMQLFSIGLIQLNPDGTSKLNGSGLPIETYTAADVTGMAKVFTGWSFACPDWPSDNCFRWAARASDGATNAERWSLPMRPYAQFHSTGEKRFLGVTVPAQTRGDPQASLKIALDTLAKHPNVGPFIGKQLIQRLVTSNPSPAYIRRVANAFNASGGNLQSTVMAILTDPEARDTASAYRSATFGKVREPLLRLSALLRAYSATSSTGAFLIWSTNDPATGLGQDVLQAPSVFNYFRPGYTPPNSTAAKNGLSAPEMQIVHETTSAAYVNYMRTAVSVGLGSAGFDNLGSSPDIKMEFQRNERSATVVLADQPLSLVEDINTKLMYGTMSAQLKTEIVNAISSIDHRAGINPTLKQITDTRKVRLYSALLLALASPEFQIQK